VLPASQLHFGSDGFQPAHQQGEGQHRRRGCRSPYESLHLSQLKQRLTSAGVDFSTFLEKSEFVEALQVSEALRSHQQSIMDLPPALNTHRRPRNPPTSVIGVSVGCTLSRSSISCPLISASVNQRRLPCS
jgi:hypothetical protein